MLFRFISPLVKDADGGTAAADLDDEDVEEEQVGPSLKKLPPKRTDTSALKARCLHCLVVKLLLTALFVPFCAGPGREATTQPIQ